MCCQSSDHNVSGEELSSCSLINALLSFRGITAGLLVQNTLKYLLGFGKVSDYLGYNALDDFFPMISLKPNTTCTDSWCIKQQAVFAAKPKREVVLEVPVDEGPLHEENEFGIELVDESAPVVVVGQGNKAKNPTGLKLAYDAPDESADNGNTVVVGEDVSLEELMKQMNSI